MSDFNVYLYLDDNDVIRYVGRGTADRILSDKNEDFARAWEESGPLYAEVMELPSKDAMEAVEGALISVLSRPDLSAKLTNQRQDKYQFVPYKLPEALLYRRALPPVDYHTVAEIVGGPALYVILNNQPVHGEDQGRVDRANPSDADWLDRTRKWWPYGDHVPDWIEHPDQAPKVLIGVQGRVKRRFIGAALDLRGLDWTQVVREPPIKDVEIPISALPGGESIDAFDLRGRSVAGIKFDRGKPFNWAYRNAKGERVPDVGHI